MFELAEKLFSQSFRVYKRGFAFLFSKILVKKFISIKNQQLRLQPTVSTIMTKLTSEDFFSKHC